MGGGKQTVLNFFLIPTEKKFNYKLVSSEDSLIQYIKHKLCLYMRYGLFLNERMKTFYK